jgi:endoglucanase
MDGELIAGHSLDNRASVAVLTEALQLLQNRSHPWDVWAVASAQEEETLGGALTSGYALEPTIAVVIDVTFAKGPGTPAHESYEMDKGPTIGWGPNIHPKLYNLLKELADSLEIPVQKEISPRMSGTDAIATQIVRNGIPTVLIGIPLNYMHTPVEVISMKNVRRAGRLLAEFIAGLDADFMQKLSWEEA